MRARDDEAAGYRDSLSWCINIDIDIDVCIHIYIHIDIDLDMIFFVKAGGPYKEARIVAQMTNTLSTHWLSRRLHRE